MSTVNLYTPRKCTNANFNVKQKSLKALESFVLTMKKFRNGRLGGLAIQIRQRMQKPVTDNAFLRTWKVTFHRRLEFSPERKDHSPTNAEKGKHVVPFEPLAQIKECEDHKYAEGDDFLYDF